jgi:hypothetical protein
LDGITLYWLTDTAASSARLYYESFGKDFVRMPLELGPSSNVACSQPADLPSKTAEARALLGVSCFRGGR